ncbi:MAG: 3'-5' exonuclease [Rhodocyclaceae bacterium]|nr:3'-5' exonuclease [Rhodocyclaceae bacterium]
MSWWQNLFGKPPALAEAQHQALAAYRALPKCDSAGKLDAQRFIVVDVESSGLSLSTDRLIAIGAVAVEHGAVRLDQGFEVVLQQAAPSSVDNILIHGIGGTSQTTGMAPAAALLAFLAYVKNSPLVAYHAPFDRSMIDTATQATLGIKIHNPWLDLAYLAPALFPELVKGSKQPRALDDWTNNFAIANTNRHNAVADALATAQLLLVLLSRAQQQVSQGGRLRDLMQMEKAAHWLAR